MFNLHLFMRHARVTVFGDESGKRSPRAIQHGLLVGVMRHWKMIACKPCVHNPCFHKHTGLPYTHRASLHTQADVRRDLRTPQVNHEEISSECSSIDDAHAHCKMFRGSVLVRIVARFHRAAPELSKRCNLLGTLPGALAGWKMQAA